MLLIDIDLRLLTFKVQNKEQKTEKYKQTKILRLNVL